MASPRSSIRSGLKQSKSAGLSTEPKSVETDQSDTVDKAPPKKSTAQDKVLVGSHFDPSVRDALKKVGAQGENLRKSQRDLLGEAINDLCAKYKVPQPYTMGS